MQRNANRPTLVVGAEREPSPERSRFSVGRKISAELLEPVWAFLPPSVAVASCGLRLA